MDIMWYEVFAEEREAIRRHVPPHIRSEFTDQTIQAAGHTNPPATLISVRTQSVIPPSWAARLHGVLTRSAGFDHLLRFAREAARPIPAGYLPDYCARAVAEQALLMLLALWRRLGRQTRQFRTFHRDQLTGVECAGKTVLVVGVGHIGREVATIARGIGMRVLGVDLVRRVSELDYVGLDDGIRAADAIVCALPLTPHTRGLLDESRLRQARRGALLVNVSRGEVSPARDLLRLLQDGVLGGIGLDVFEDEAALASYLRGESSMMPASSRPMLSLMDDERVLCTPHNAFNTCEALERKATQSADAATQFLATGTFPNPVPLELSS